MHRFEKYGFEVDDNNTKFISFFNNASLDKIHMDVYSNDPYILFSRVIDDNIRSVLDNGRFILRKKDGTIIVNLLLEDIKNCVTKKYGDVCCEFIFKVYSICYKLIVFITK